MEAEFLLSICNACGVSWALTERFGELSGAFREVLGAPGELFGVPEKELGAPADVVGVPGEANFEDVRGVWDI